MKPSWQRAIKCLGALIAAATSAGCPLLTRDGFNVEDKAVPGSASAGEAENEDQGGAAGAPRAVHEGGKRATQGGATARGGATSVLGGGRSTTAGGTFNSTGGSTGRGGSNARGGNAISETAGAATSDAGASSDGPGLNTCQDHIIDGSESDIDCGGTCAKCEDGRVCVSNTDCAAGRCSSSLTCRSCGLRLISTELACPPECNSCAGGTCYMLCDGGSACKNTVAACPKGFACTVMCTGAGSCENLQVSCPSEFPCDVECSGKRSCSTANLRCGSGPCTLRCSADGACDAAVATCGTDRCAAECSSGASMPQLSCGAACDCSPCSG